MLLKLDSKLIYFNNWTFLFPTHPSVLWTGLLEEKGTLNGCALQSPKLRLSEYHKASQKQTSSVSTMCVFESFFNPEPNEMQSSDVGPKHKVAQSGQKKEIIQGKGKRLVAVKHIIVTKQQQIKWAEDRRR